MANDVYTSPLASRYASPYMLHLFSPDSRFQTWRRLWVALARAQHQLGLPITARQVQELEAHVTDIDYEVAALKNDYVDDATKPGMNPSETEVQEYYDAHDWTVDGVEGKAPLADVKANVKTALRTERYRERVQSKADKIDVSTLPWKRLYAYAATLVG